MKNKLVAFALATLVTSGYISDFVEARAVPSAQGSTSGRSLVLKIQ